MLIVLTTTSYALSQSAGNLVFVLAPGQSSELSYLLTNDLNTSTSIELRGEGDVVTFLTLPDSVVLEPHETQEVLVRASVPETVVEGQYRGKIIALQKGTGAVKINVELEKDVIVTIRGTSQPVPFQTVLYALAAVAIIAVVVAVAARRRSTM